MNQRNVEKKQPNSKMCFVCGLDNKFGLRARFFELEGRELAGIFFPAQEHQGYPGRLHGGVASSILDETIGRSILIDRPDRWWITISLDVKFRLPVPLDAPIRVLARTDTIRGKIYEGSGEILLKDGRVAVSAKAKFLTQDEIIEDETFANEMWKTVTESEDPQTLEMPEAGR